MLLRKGEKIDIDAIHAAREYTRLTLAKSLKPRLLALYNARLGADPTATDGAAMGNRALKNICLAYLGLLNDHAIDTLAFTQFKNAATMTDCMAALAVLSQRETLLRGEALHAFYEKWKDNDLILDKWFAVQAGADREGILDEVKKLMEHSAFTFTNPNKIYALVGTFCANLPHFHKSDGSGYHFLADVIIRLDALNPQVAGRRVNPLARWRDYAEPRASLMRGELERIANTPNISKNTLEVVQAGLKSG
jgi:aminopeptidase N